MLGFVMGSQMPLISKCLALTSNFWVSQGPHQPSFHWISENGVLGAQVDGQVSIGKLQQCQVPQCPTAPGGLLPWLSWTPLLSFFGCILALSDICPIAIIKEKGCLCSERQLANQLRGLKSPHVYLRGRLALILQDYGTELKHTEGKCIVLVMLRK